MNNSQKLIKIINNEIEKKIKQTKFIYKKFGTVISYDVLTGMTVVKFPNDTTNITVKNLSGQLLKTNDTVVVFLDSNDLSKGFIYGDVNNISTSSSESTGVVESVNEKTGVVILNADDIDDTNTLKKYVTAADKTKLSNISGVNTGNETSASIGSIINTSTEKTTPINADMVGLMDSANSNILKKLSWNNIKATLKTYFDGLYALTGHIHTKTDIGLENVDNTSDINKPISSSAQTALDSKLDKAGGTMTGELMLNGAPFEDLHAVTKKFVEDKFNQVTTKIWTGTIAEYDALTVIAPDTVYFIKEN